MLEASQTLLSVADLNDLLEQANQSAYIVHISLANIQQFQAQKSILFFYDNQRMLGIAAWSKINAYWCEVGPFIVSKHARGKGIGSEILSTTIQTCERAGFHLYGVSKNPAMQHLFVKMGFKIRHWWQIPPIIQWYLLKKMNIFRIWQARSRLSPEPLIHYLKEE